MTARQLRSLCTFTVPAYIKGSIWQPSLNLDICSSLVTTSAACQMDKLLNGIRQRDTQGISVPAVKGLRQMT